jgi:hypothetical protein
MIRPPEEPHPFHSQHAHESGQNLALEGYDAVPRDGPAVFVADRTRLAAGDLFGRWVRLDQTIGGIALEVSLVTDQPAAEGGWTILDQAQLGEVMCDEALTFDGLTRLAEQVGGRP